jgi:hypothetical protein
MKPCDILSNTPARGLEFQVEYDQGTFITNHGAGLSDALIDRTVSNPKTLSSQLNSVKQWLTEPVNHDQVIVIQLVNNATTPDKQTAINDMLKQTF